METDSQNGKEKGGCLKLALIMAGVACMTAVVTFWVAKVYLFPREFKPVQLSTKEEKVLNRKIDALTIRTAQKENRTLKNRKGDQVRKAPKEVLTPEPYREKDADREIRLTERELNGLLANNTTMADKLAIDLSDDLASAKLLIPLDPELPIFGGKTLKVTAGMELRYGDQRPVAILKGVSVWGVPLPNEWLGGIKNIDLVREFGNDQGFWHKLAAGIEHIRIEDGILSIKLKP